MGVARLVRVGGLHAVPLGLAARLEALAEPRGPTGGGDRDLRLLVGTRHHERIRDYGILKAIGLTPRQITSTVVSAHAALALIASLLAVPLGIGLYLAMYGIAGDTTEDAVLRLGGRSP